jgi:hypothetical protein
MEGVPLKAFTLFTSLLPAIFQFAEDVWGPGKGSNKFDTAMQLAKATAVSLASVGIIPVGAAHDTLAITNIVQNQFDEARAKGLIEERKAAPVPVEKPAPLLHSPVPVTVKEPVTAKELVDNDILIARLREIARRGVVLDQPTQKEEKIDPVAHALGV